MTQEEAVEKLQELVNKARPELLTPNQDTLVAITSLAYLGLVEAELHPVLSLAVLTQLVNVVYTMAYDHGVLDSKMREKPVFMPAVVKFTDVVQ